MDARSAQLIMAVVPKDIADAVLAAALGTGATGATSWKGTGTGVEYETFLDAVFRFPPDREIVAVIAPDDIADDVFDAITEVAPVDTPGTGFVASVDLARVAGIRNVLAAA